MELPTSVTGLLVGAGLLLIIGALFGGGLEVKEFKIPHIGKGMRALSFAVGAVLIALAVVPPMLPERGPETTQSSNGSDSGSVSESAGQSTGMPDYIGMSRDEAERAVVGDGFSVDDVSIRQSWAPDGHVIDQSPNPGVSAGEDEAVDLTVADSNFRFRAVHSITNNVGEYSATMDFDVRRFRPATMAEDVGEFEVTRIDIEVPVDEADDLPEVTNAMTNEPGYVSLSALDDYTLTEDWEALRELTRDLEEENALHQINDNSGVPSSLGKGILLAFLIVEIEFDVRAIMYPPPDEQFGDAEPVVLQVGDDMKSTIRVEGPPRIAAGGEELSYTIMRRTTDEEEFTSVGSANYSAYDGLLVSLEASFFAGPSDSEDMFYKVEIERR